MAQDRRILVIETSSRVGGVALATESAVVCSLPLEGQMRYAGDLMPTIARGLRDQGWSAGSLTDVFVSMGPGSFTGLRIAVTVARTLAWSVGTRVVAVPTLDALARNALGSDPNPPHVAVILDAKQGRVFAAAYELKAGRYECIVDAHLAEPAAFLACCPRPLAVLGEGIHYHHPAVADSGAVLLDECCWWPRAENVYAIGRELALAGRYTLGGDLLPLYIRRPEAEEKWEKLHDRLAGQREKKSGEIRPARGLGHS